jgi:hypothetical protein
MHWGKCEMLTKFYYRIMLKMGELEDLDEYGMIIIKLILKECI